MLIALPPIFVAHTKIIYGYNFVSPLKLIISSVIIPSDTEVSLDLSKLYLD